MGLCIAGENKLPGLSSSSTLAWTLAFPEGTWDQLELNSALRSCGTGRSTRRVVTLNAYRAMPSLCSCSSGSTATTVIPEAVHQLRAPLWCHQTVPLVKTDHSTLDWGVTTTACLQLHKGCLQSSTLYSTNPSLASWAMHTFAACPRTHSQPAWPHRAHSSIC